MASEYVIDSNVAINWLVPGHPYYCQAQKFVRDCAVDDITLIAPPTFISEADSTIRLAVHTGQLNSEIEQDTFDLLDALPVAIFMNAAVRRRARVIARQLR